MTSDRPGIVYTDAGGAECEVRCHYLVGADGSRSICRFEIPQALRTHYFREYPFAWFGILAEAPKSAPELVYTHSATRLRADQPAHPDAAADVLPVRPGRRRERLAR